MGKEGVIVWFFECVDFGGFLVGFSGLGGFLGVVEVFEYCVDKVSFKKVLDNNCYFLRFVEFFRELDYEFDWFGVELSLVEVVGVDGFGEGCEGRVVEGVVEEVLWCERDVWFYNFEVLVWDGGVVF